jgi:large subunit ribosomal protein L53
MREETDKVRLLTACVEDGKEMKLDLSNMRITQVVEEVDRHSRGLARKEELTGN